jgi:hypothetical protein
MMNPSTRVIRRPRRAWPPTARTAAAIIATAALALLAAACSGSPSSTGSGGAPHAAGSSSSPSAVAYSACMRSHGVPNFPDPDPGSGGAIPKADPQRLRVSTSQLQAAQTACQHLLPAGGSFEQQTEQCMSTGNCPSALVQQILTAERKFARCMRSHGVPKYPDPTIDSQGRPIFVFSISNDGFDPHEPQIMTKEDECQRVAPAPEPRQVNP